MICISIAQESRRLAQVDILNAAGQCDLLEIRLDRFGKSPEIGPLLESKPRPMILACKRKKDGGAFEGSEDERLAILRQCVISKADHVEIEVDVADKVPRFGPTKRVISYTNLRETPADIADIYAQAQQHDPDVIKLTTLARTPEEAWPLVQILAKPPVPTVVVGLGKPGMMLAILGRKIGAPWTYAALEKGMEAHPDQPTVNDLTTIYHYPSIEKTTRFVGVLGFGRREYETTAILNTAFAFHKLPARCLPLSVGSMKLFRKVLDVVKAAALVVDEGRQSSILDLASERDPVCQRTGLADLLLHVGDQWKAHDTTFRGLIGGLETALRPRFSSPTLLRDRIVVVVGVNGRARSVAQALQAEGASLIIASYDRAAAQEMASQLRCRFLQTEAIYSTMHDVLVLCDDERSTGKGRAGVQPSGLRAGQVIVDLTIAERTSPFLLEAQSRGCAIVTPMQMRLEHALYQARMLTHKDTPREHILEMLPWLEDE